MMNISELRKKQKRYGITYTDIAQYCKLHRVNVARILTGETRYPRKDNLSLIEKAIENIMSVKGAKQNKTLANINKNTPPKKNKRRCKMMLGDEVLSFFGLTRDPWEDGDCEEIWESESFKTVTNQILEAMKRNAFLLVTGETGCGKSVLIQKIRKKVKYWKNQITVYVSPLFTEDFTQSYLASEIIEGCLNQSAPRHKRERAHKLVECMLKVKRQRQNVVLVLDEVHQLKDDIMKALKRLHEGLGVHSSKLGVILIGQPEILDELNNPYLREVDKRLSRICLDPFDSNKGTNPKKVKEYITHKIKLCGGDPSIFTDDAINEIALRVETLQDVNDLLSGLMYDVWLSGEEKVITKEVVEEHH
jgi:type II secretory pathway predicted ATPase ExeA